MPKGRQPHNIEKFVRLEHDFDASSHFIELADGRRSNDLITAEAITKGIRWPLLKWSEGDAVVDIINPLMPSGAFNICCPRDAVSRTANVDVEVLLSLLRLRQPI